MKKTTANVKVKASPQRSLLQLKKIVSGEISKKPFLDILLTDLEQSSFSLIWQNKIKQKKCSRLRSTPMTACTLQKATGFVFPSYCRKSIRLVPFFEASSPSPRWWSKGKGIDESLQKLRFLTPRLKKNYIPLPRTKTLQNLLCEQEYEVCSNELYGKDTRRVSLPRGFVGDSIKSNFSQKKGVLCQVKTGDYVHCGDQIGDLSGTPIVVDESGKILKINLSQITIQKMQPVLFYSQAEIHVESNEWVKRGTPLLTLAHQTLVTGDIVQGIPRIEQLFEASTSTPPGTQDFGSYSENDSSIKCLQKIYDYVRLRSQRNSVYRSFDKDVPNTVQNAFIMHSTIEEKPLLLYNTLQSQVRQLFRKKWDIFPLPVAVRQSLEEIQQIIVQSIQKVYISQGVLIADKHIEIIVRQMTSKAQIFDGGSTGLLIDEILSLQQIENANISTPGQKALYLPVIMGLTRAALSSDSFVSAASFQETTRVLSRDAIAGKSDFLRGLKEKVIIGDLIDAGTGLDVFYIYSLFSKKVFENKFIPNENPSVTHKMLKKLVLRATK